MTALEIVQSLAEQSSTRDFVGWVEKDCRSSYYDTDRIFRDDQKYDGYEFSVVDEEGGYEGGGETVERVIEVKKDGKLTGYVSIGGYYGSYSGTEYDEPSEFTEVFPVVRPTTYYLDRSTLTTEEKVNLGLV